MGNRESASKRPHEDPQVWQDAMLLVEEVYRFSARFPYAERFGLTSQIRGAAVSVPSNIAEGAARRSRNEYVRHLSIARGPLAELDTQQKIATHLGFSSESPPPIALIESVFARLTALMNSLTESERSQ